MTSELHTEFVPFNIPPVTLQLLILYRHLVMHPHAPHSPYRLLRAVPRLQSKTLHKTMRSLEEAGILICTRVTQAKATPNELRRKDYRLTHQGYAYILSELADFQLPPEASQIPDDLPQVPVGPVTPRLRPDVKRRDAESEPMVILDF